MNPPSQNSPRLLPFDRESPGAWQRWEDFWVDFLNADPLLPWPGKPFRFKRSIAAEKWGVAGGSQDGIDMRADMEDGTVLAVQCKDWKTVDPTNAKKAMDKAEKEFKEAQAYFLVFTEKEISADIQKDADRRGNWKVIGRDTLSSWFLSGKFLDVEDQKRLIKKNFEYAFKNLFPHPGDDLLISPAHFFKSQKLIRHDALLQGKEFKALAETLATALGEGNPQITILSAPGGQGKTRLLKATAELVESRYPNRKFRFHNDSAGADAEDYGIRGADFKDLCLFIDDAHRLENVRMRILKMVAESGTASVLIAARPNNIQALERRLEDCGFREGHWQKFEVPVLDHEGRRALAVEILGTDDGKTPDFLAEESERCPLICTVGAELIRSGGIGPEVLKSDGFKRRVFDHLMKSTLDQLFSDDPEYRKTSELCLRAIALLAPLSKTDQLAANLARVIERKSMDVDPVLSRLVEAGLLRTTRGSLRVVPDLLSDHLVYDTAYGAGKNQSLVQKLMEAPHASEPAMFFANLAEAEWRAKQEGKKDAFLDSMWNGLREMLRDPKDQRIYGLLDTWRKIAIFQPERTLELARIILDHESARVAAGNTKVRDGSFRYDPIAIHVGKLPDLLAPVATHHQDHRMEAFDLLWQIGSVKDGSTQLQDELPSAWKMIVSAASLGHWEKGGPQDAFIWLSTWVRRGDGSAMLEEGRSFLSSVASQWFESRGNRRWKVVVAIREFSAEIRKFQAEVLSWIETEILPEGLGPAWAVLPVIFAAGYQQPEEKSLELLRKVLGLYDDPLLRLSIWRYLSKRVADEDRDEGKVEWLALRNSIALDLPFQLVRLASSFAIHEWNHERLQKWEKERDYDASNRWWSDLASQTVSELRRFYPSIHQSMEQLDQANRSLLRFRKRASWDAVAEAWSKQFTEERSGVLDELMAKPDHVLVPCLGYFIGLRDETDCEFAEKHTLFALSYPDDRVRRAVLHRLSWRDVKRREQIANHLNVMSASDDSAVVASIAEFISWNQYEATPYLDGVLSELNSGVLATPDLVRVAEAVANLLEYAKHAISSDLLASFFRRLEEEEDLNKVFPDHVLSIFHDKFPVEMFRVHLNRIRAGKFLPWLLDGWFLSGLPEHLGHPEFVKTAKALFEETIRADDGHFHLFRELFDVAVARVNPTLTAELMAEELRKQPRNAEVLKRIVMLTGAGHGSVVYAAPEFTKELLKEIDLQPTVEARDLKLKLLWAALPRMWGSSDGRIDKEYLWAKDRAAPLAEHHRSDCLLKNFYLSIVKFQEDEDARTRSRFRQDD